MGELQNTTGLEKQVLGNIKKRKILTEGDSIIKIEEVEIQVEGCEDLRLIVKLHNEREYEVEETVKVYIKDVNSIYAGYEPKLYKYRITRLNEQQQKTIEIEIHSEAFTITDEKGDCYRDSNEFEIYICTGDIKNKKIKNAIIKKIQFQSIAEECSIKIG